jgi:hypothetical protein
VLEDLTMLFSKHLVLVLLEPSETLLLYVVATTQVMSTVLVVEREGPGYIYKVQWPVYYFSKVLSDSETHYSQVQKLLYAILIMKHKLLHYFESHLICVVTSFGLEEVGRNYVATGRITKWALELMGLDITYVP